MPSLAFIAFAVVAVVHLYASHARNTVLRNRTKVLLMPLLLVFYLAAGFSSPAAGPFALFVAALVFNWVGDTLLTQKGTTWFIAGGLSFFIAHFLLIAQIGTITDLAAVWPAGCGAGIVYAICTAVILRRDLAYLEPRIKPLAFFYLIVNAVMNCFAFMYLTNTCSLSGALVYAGAVSFYVSDVLLCEVRFNKASRIKTHTSVMATYLAAMTFLACGLLLSTA